MSANRGDATTFRSLGAFVESWLVKTNLMSNAVSLEMPVLVTATVRVAEVEIQLAVVPMPAGGTISPKLGSEAVDEPSSPSMLIVATHPSSNGTLLVKLTVMVLAAQAVKISECGQRSSRFFLVSFQLMEGTHVLQPKRNGCFISQQNKDAQP